jgi:flagellar motor switch protein FliG
MQKILGSIETRTLALALKASPQDVQDNILSNLSARVRLMVAEEKELAGAVPMTDVQSARGEILKNVRALMESGEFKPARAGAELVE